MDVEIDRTLSLDYTTTTKIIIRKMEIFSKQTQVPSFFLFLFNFDLILEEKKYACNVVVVVVVNLKIKPR